MANFEDIYTDTKFLEKLALKEEGSVIMRCFLNLRNPLTIDKDLVSWGPSDFRNNNYNIRGHDGIIYPNAYEGKDEGDNFAYLVFNPKNIKSATKNKGTFDANNSDIYYQAVFTRQAFSDWFKRTKGVCQAKCVENLCSSVDITTASDAVGQEFKSPQARHVRFPVFVNTQFNVKSQKIFPQQILKLLQPQYLSSSILKVFALFVLRRRHSLVLPLLLLSRQLCGKLL